MNKKNKLIIIIIIALLFFFLIINILKNPQIKNATQQKNSISQTETSKSLDNDFMQSLLEGYPDKQVPIYQAESIDAVKFFVNFDPQNIADFFPKNKNYYNLVYKTKAEPSEFLKYYKSIMSNISQEDTNESQVAGFIDRYKVLASHYGHDNNAYLQIYLSDNEFSQENKYYADNPNLIEPDESWQEHENSYGKMAQQGGIIEYTKYWTVDREKIEDFEKIYTEEYQNKANFKNDDQGGLSWTDEGYKINLTFSEDHGRVYLMMRRPK